MAHETLSERSESQPAILEPRMDGPPSHESATVFTTPSRHTGWAASDSRPAAGLHDMQPWQLQHSNPSMQPSAPQQPASSSGKPPYHSRSHGRHAHAVQTGNASGQNALMDLSIASPEEVEAALDAVLTSRFEKERARMLAVVRGSGGNGRSRMPPWDSARDAGVA